MPDLGIPRENIVFVSGIGCSSRFPYYMNTYGFHSIHGRAPTIATGLKASRPELSVWVVTGDGDALSIGGNHLLHVLRRNIDLKIILLNNEIYGLTKGQYSPTSRVGKRTKSTPSARSTAPLRPLSVAIGAEATFVARSVDMDAHHLVEMLDARRATPRHSVRRDLPELQHLQRRRLRRLRRQGSARRPHAHLEHGKPMIFGKERDKGIRLNGLKLEVVELGKNGITEADLLVHDETREDPTIAFCSAAWTTRSSRCPSASSAPSSARPTTT